MKNNLSKKALGITGIAVASALIVFVFAGRYFGSFLRDVANFFLGSFGMSFYGVMVAVIVACSFSLANKKIRIPTKYIVHFCLLFVTVVLFVHTLTTLYLPKDFAQYADLVYHYYDKVPTMGGVVFGAVAYALKTVLSLVGAIILYVASLVVNVIFIGDFFYCYATGNLVLRSPSAQHKDDDESFVADANVTMAEPSRQTVAQQPRTARDRAMSVLFDNETDEELQGGGSQFDPQYADLPENSDTPLSEKEVQDILFGRSLDRPQQQTPSVTNGLSFSDSVIPQTDSQTANSFFSTEGLQRENARKVTPTPQEKPASDFFSTSDYAQKQNSSSENQSWRISDDEVKTEFSRPQTEVHPQPKQDFSPSYNGFFDGNKANAPSEIANSSVAPDSQPQQPANPAPQKAEPVVEQPTKPADDGWKIAPIVDYDGKQEGYMPAKPAEQGQSKEPAVADVPFVQDEQSGNPFDVELSPEQPSANASDEVDVTEIVADAPETTQQANSFDAPFVADEPKPQLTAEQKTEPVAEQPVAEVKAEEPQPTAEPAQDDVVIVPTEKLVKGGIQTGFDVVPKKEYEEQQTKIHHYLEYNVPPMEILGEPQPHVDDEAGDRQAAAESIVKKLAVFGIQIELADIIVGPAFSRYMFRVLSQKTRMGDFAKYSDDIKACLEAPEDIRIEAPVHGTNLVGIEVANRKKSVVTLREVLESDNFQNANGNLVFAIGKDIMGHAIVKDLAKFPHLLVAGQTASGKSVALHSLIVSLMYKYTPEYLRFVMVDPKIVELSRYNGIPHMLTTETITKTNDALAAMDYLINEMESRYLLFKSAGVANLADYNKRINPQTTQKLPYIVYIVDELADLMTVCKQPFEQKISRLAAKARAAGIHLVLATQRPDVKVITGNIKANLSARIALTVASQFDSRTIIDCGGAEKLLGRGDMLLMDPSASDLDRIQGAYISNDEIHDVVEYLKNSNETFFDPEAAKAIFVTEAQEEAAAREAQAEAEAAANKETQVDPYCKKALRFWLERNSGKASIASIQRALSIGFGRAGRIVNQLQELKYVEEPSASESSFKPLKVLVTVDQLDDIFPDLEG